MIERKEMIKQVVKKRLQRDSRVKEREQWWSTRPGNGQVKSRPERLLNSCVGINNWGGIFNNVKQEHDTVCAVSTQQYKY